ncbi:hypothetical protein HPB50_001548 [Hyalomma asiaticum]|uniref:Uncharacterized protein n=1 Tax=Hyalomma asiaticum TaxID=266040 RepID=A0ACB7RUQ8_HYAAI|nr:hypothetical protein HPB50_001548 [Hyalomma asiaticum]
MISIIFLASAAASFLSSLLWTLYVFIDTWLWRWRSPHGSKLPPMPPASSIQGHVELLRNDFHRKKCAEWTKEFGPVIRLKIYFQNVVILNDNNSIKKFFNAKEVLWRWPTFVGYSDFYKGLAQLNGERWSANRKFCLSMLRDLGFAKTAMEGRMMVREQIKLYKASMSADDTKDFIHGYIKKIEESRGHPHPLFLDRYLVGNINNFLMAATFTTTLTMTWHMLNFAKNPDTVQARVQREIEEVVGQERLPTWEDRKRMPYTLACVWEMDRWKTATPLGVARECAEDIVADNVFIPKGTIVLPNIWAVHNEPSLWKDPGKFIPERYLTEDGQLVPQKPEYLIPFSIGRRDCPGQTFAAMEIFLLVTFLLQKYRILPEHPSEIDLDSPDFALSHATKVKLRFLPRKSAKC